MTTGVNIAIGDQSFRQTLFAGSGQRWKAGEPGTGERARKCIGHPFLGAPHQRRATRPVRICIKKRFDIGEWHIDLLSPETAPLDQRQRQRMVDLFGTTDRGSPLVTGSSSQGLLKLFPIRLAQDTRCRIGGRD
ncbi:MAG: hypothetical protein J4F40_05600 [Alphaproteobacteria bacterium]|nr:hypothetical protein [Alphaproteobacteria bacterium]MCY4499647.1 hypothetical protein [Rhodospirillaceae bacterium]